MLHAFDIDAQIDIDAAKDLARDYQRRSELRCGSRTPWLDTRTDGGSRAAMLAALEASITRVEARLGVATVAEARRLA